MWMMLQAPTAEDYVIATGETHTVKEMLELAFDRLQLDWKKHVKIDAKYYRPTEVDLLIGDASKAKKQLGWQPKVKFEELIAMMVDADLAAEKEKLDGTRKRN
jgi:GDPmannose 4,6-dehydratase